MSFIRRWARLIRVNREIKSIEHDLAMGWYVGVPDCYYELLDERAELQERRT